MSPPPPVIEGPSEGGGGSWEENRGPGYTNRLTRDDNSMVIFLAPARNFIEVVG